MKSEDLQNLVGLNRSIEFTRAKLEDLRSAAGLKSQSFDDTPRAPGAHDRIGELVPQIVDEEERLRSLLAEYIREKDRLDNYIDTVPNYRIRLILQLRYRYGMSWQEVADTIGGRETENSVRMAASRFIDGITFSEK